MGRLRRAPLLLALAAAAAPTVAQPPARADHAVTGRVRDDRTDAPVAGVMLEVFADSAATDQARWAARTTAAGQYQLTGIPTGRWWLRLRRAG